MPCSEGLVNERFQGKRQIPGLRVGTVQTFMLQKASSSVIRTTRKLQLASSERKPILDDEQVAALTKAFKETDGFSYTIAGKFKAAAEDAQQANISKPDPYYIILYQVI
jgi:hypothetical protein